MTIIETTCLVVLMLLGSLAAFTLGWYAGHETGYRQGRLDAQRWEAELEQWAQDVWPREEREGQDERG
jgi:hypothetical protein